MWKILQIATLFGIAVVIGLLVHPLLSIVFLLLAKIISLFLADVYRGYQETYMEKQKRHLQTADGERLEIVEALEADDIDPLELDPPMKEGRV